MLLDLSFWVSRIWKIWIDHISTVVQNRKRGAIKAAATCRMKQQARLRQESAQQQSDHVEREWSEECYCVHVERLLYLTRSVLDRLWPLWCMVLLLLWRSDYRTHLWDLLLQKVHVANNFNRLLMPTYIRLFLHMYIELLYILIQKFCLLLTWSSVFILGESAGIKRNIHWSNPHAIPM